MNKATFDAMVAQYAVQEASGEGAASWDGGVRCVLPEVLVYGKAIQNGTPTPDAPITPEFSAGTTVQCGDTVAVAPELLAIPGTEHRDEWNPQTGKGVRRVVRFEPDGTESWYKNASYGDYESFFLSKATYLPGGTGIKFRKGLCNIFPSDVWSYIEQADGDYFWNAPVSFGFRIHKSYLGDDYDTLATDADKIECFKTFLADKAAAGTPIIVWLPANDEPFQTEPQPLIQPKGTGHIMQVGGNLDAVPITAKYATHS